MISLDDSLNSMSGFSDIIPRIGTDLNVIDHLYHPSDLNVAPIADNPRILKLTVLKWDAQAINIPLYAIEKLSQTTKEDVVIFINSLFTCMQNLGKTPAGSSGLRQKMHILAYLVAVSKLDQVSNIIVEKGHTKFLLSELKTSPSSDMKMRLGK